MDRYNVPLHDTSEADFLAFEQAAEELAAAEAKVARQLQRTLALAAKLHGRISVAAISKRLGLSRGLVYHALTYQRDEYTSPLHAIAKVARQIADEQTTAKAPSAEATPSLSPRRKPPRLDPVDAAARNAVLVAFTTRQS